MAEKVFIGIDPGITGAIAIVTETTALVFDFDDRAGVAYLRNLHRPLCKAVIESVHAMPKQGVSSTFKFGVNFGIWQGRLEILKIPYDLVTPQKWKKVMFDSMAKGFDLKSMSIDRALRIFPEMIDFLKRKKDHGRAEALLLAEYCRREAK